MKTLDQRLAESFRAVRWADSAGQPVCPSCYHGDDVREGYTQHRWLKSSDALKTYFCACCKYPFSDLTKTVLARSCRPLALWAYLALNGDNDGLIPPGTAQQWKREDLRQMRERLKVSQLAKSWAARLTHDGITVAQLAAQLTSDRAWWGKA